MKFSDNIQNMFASAGWKKGRNVTEDLIYPYTEYPQFAKDFINEYGNLKIEVLNKDFPAHSSQIIIDPDAGTGDLEGNGSYSYYSSLIAKKLFPVGFYLPDAYHIACDADGHIYMLGEYCYLRGKYIYEGIENIINGWNFLLQLDEENGKWSDTGGNPTNPNKYKFSL